MPQCVPRAWEWCEGTLIGHTRGQGSGTVMQWEFELGLRDCVGVLQMGKAVLGRVQTCNVFKKQEIHWEALSCGNHNIC